MAERAVLSEVKGTLVEGPIDSDGKYMSLNHKYKQSSVPSSSVFVSIIDPISSALIREIFSDITKWKTNLYLGNDTA